MAMPPDDIARLQAKLTALRHRDTQFQVFGASSHRYLFNPCLSEQQVQDAETRYGIALPDEYRRFLLCLGNGGAGPDYGIFALQDSLETYVVDVRFLREPFPHVQAWNLTWEELGLDRERARDREAFIDAYYNNGAHTQGALIISTEGCAYYTLLVIAGEERGHVWVDEMVDEKGLRPLSAPEQPRGRLSFFAWYERWLDRWLGSLGKAT